MKKAISERMAADSISYGCFTYIYLHCLSDPELTDTQERCPLTVLSLVIPDEPVLRKCWRGWMLGQLAKDDELDNSHTGTLVRYAVGSIRLSELTRERTRSPGLRWSLVSDLKKIAFPV